jgi:hypothetical protein
MARFPLADTRRNINDPTRLAAHGFPGVCHGRKGGSHMRMLMNVTMPHEPFNTAVRDGSVGEKLERILKETGPEAVYFTERNGHRGAILIFDLADPSKIPAVSEPWFLAFNANVEFRIVMTPEDLKKAGLGDVGRKWPKAA